MYFKGLIIIVLISLFFEQNFAFSCIPCICESAKNLMNVSCSYKTTENTENIKLNQIPPSIQTYSSKEEIVNLDFKGQHFNNLDGLTVFYNVETIIFTKNLINNLHSNDLKNLTKLERLKLDSNQISEIPSDFFQSNRKISFIFLDNNKITLLTRNTFENLLHLKEVHLNQNYIERIEDNCFVNVPLLSTLDLKNNKLTTLSLKFIDHWDKLEYVFLDKNSWLCDSRLCDLINTSLEKNWLHGIIPECFHSNGTKTYTDWESLQILEPLQIFQFQSPVHVNQTVVLNCQVHTCSFPSMVWDLNGNPLENSTHCIEGYKHTLTVVFDGIQKDDEGLYTCSINNCSICPNSSRYLTVNDVDDVELNVDTTTWKEEHNISSGNIDINLPDVDLPDICLDCIWCLILGIFLGIFIGIFIGFLIIIFLLPICCCSCIFQCKCFQWFIKKLGQVVKDFENRIESKSEEQPLNSTTKPNPEEYETTF